jgi:hypothetical protein
MLLRAALAGANKSSARPVRVSAGLFGLRLFRKGPLEWGRSMHNHPVAVGVVVSTEDSDGAGASSRAVQASVMTPRGPRSSRRSSPQLLLSCPKLETRCWSPLSTDVHSVPMSSGLCGTAAVDVPARRHGDSDPRNEAAGDQAASGSWRQAAMSLRAQRRSTRTRCSASEKTLKAKPRSR